MDQKIIILLIDGLRKDFIDEKLTPYLASLKEKFQFSEIETILGYSDAIDATIFTGLYPNRNGYWIKYWYDPLNSPFIHDYKFLKNIDRIPSSFIRSSVNFFLYNTHYKKFAKRLGYHELAVCNIPYKIVNNFDFTMKKSIRERNPFQNIPTLFDLLIKNGKKFNYIYGLHPELMKNIIDSDIVIIYFDDIDFSAHLFGLDNILFNRTLQKLDKKIEFIIKKVENNVPDVNILIFSDHGMATVYKKFNFYYMMKDPNFIERFLFALDGTMIRFWYFDEEIKDIIRFQFENRVIGKFLTEDDRKKYKINFNHNRYGDDIFLLNQGYAIYPNFMSWANPRAMHAYDPLYKEQKGIFFLNKEISRNKINQIKMVDIMPTVLDILNIEIHTEIDGESILI